MYIFKVGEGEWEAKKLDKSSEYQGGIKIFSLCNVGNQRTLMSGGVLVSNNTAVSSVFEFNMSNMFASLRKKNMQQKRYGHSSCSIKGTAYVLGGYSHNDTPGEPPQTLAHCEKFNSITNNWEIVSGMN